MRTIQPVLSAEIFVIPLQEERYLIYAPLRKAAFVGNAAIVNLLADLKSGEMMDHIDKNSVDFLRQLEILDAGDEQLPIKELAGLPSPESVTLFLTNACNLRCSYCYASAGEAKLQYMSLETAKKGIDFVIANALKNGSERIEVNYHGGGEPTVHWNVLTKSLLYARKEATRHHLELISSVASNGVLDDEKIDWIIANMSGASVSFDGLPAVHDAYRKTVSGKGSSERVRHTLRRFDEAGFDYGIRVTVTEDMISYMADSVAFLCENFKTCSIQVEPVYQIGKWTGAPSAETEFFLSGFRSAQTVAERYERTLFFSGARLGLLTNHFCSATQDLFALTPDGVVSACYEVFSENSTWKNVFFYGRYDEPDKTYRFDSSRIEFLRSQAVQNRSYCKTCFAKWSCGGDCYHKSLLMTGNKKFAGTDRCHIIRELTKDQILLRIAEAGGLFWHEE